MDLITYYKKAVYDHGYYMAEYDEKNFNKNHKDITNDIYFNDEMDFCIISDYTSCYELNEDDKKFIKLLGFAVEDFTGEEDGE